MAKYYLKNDDDTKKNTFVSFPRDEIEMHAGTFGLKYYLIVMYLREHVQTFGQIDLTLTDLMKGCGYSTRTHNQKVFEDYRNIIDSCIIQDGYAICSIDISKIKPNTKFTLNLSSDKDLFCCTDDGFVQLNVYEFEKIVQSTSFVNKSTLVGTYLFIKQFIFSNSNTTVGHAEISFPSKKQMSAVLSLSVSTVENAIDALRNLGLIYVRSNMFVEDSKCKGYYVPTRNVFALKESALKGEHVLTELSAFYKRTVYDRENVPGKTKFITE